MAHLRDDTPRLHTPWFERNMFLYGIYRESKNYEMADKFRRYFEEHGFRIEDSKRMSIADRVVGGFTKGIKISSREFYVCKYDAYFGRNN